MDLSSKMYIELFHLMFLRKFNDNIAPELYAIKGGCNLRFFFQSMRYSEDLGIDVQTIQKQTLEKKVDKILNSSSFLKLLQGYGVTSFNKSSPKQTETTQRWKVQLHIDRLEMPVNTKIEFSRRHEEFQSELSDVRRETCQQYHLPPMRLSYYELHDAVKQKILALAYRSLTQARDVFDLYHLLHVENHKKIELGRNDIEKAKESLLSVGFNDYQSQVVSFLEAKYQKALSDSKHWENIVDEILVYLEGLTK